VKALARLLSVPFGRSTLAWLITVRTSSRPMPRAASACGIDLNPDGRLDLAADADQAYARTVEIFGAGCFPHRHRRWSAGANPRLRASSSTGVSAGFTFRMSADKGCDRQIRRRRVDGGQDVGCGAVDGAAQHELNRELGEAKRTRRGQLRHAGNLLNCCSSGVATDDAIVWDRRPAAAR